MRYSKVIEGVFIERPNRFIARVLIDGKIENVHVKNTGRCKELLVPDAKVYLYVSDNPNRKTKYDLIAVEKVTDRGTILVNMDSQVPNDVVGEWLKKGELFSQNAVIKREAKFGNSRFDFFVEDGGRKAFVEVKGVTLENNGVVSFPDAPTERGVKHLNELALCLENGFEAFVIFVVQMKGVYKFEPNAEHHKEFADTLISAREKGVRVLVYDCIVTPDSIEIDNKIDY
ncbi:MAG: DNA/RNA nuclease SfsA [Clostridia bacterium]|nr:DNA/RNA nuclease SfsA [Clostridia bacterium]